MIPLSSQARGLASEVALSPADGLPSACVLKPEWIRIVERAFLGPLIARLVGEASRSDAMHVAAELIRRIKRGRQAA